MNFLKMIYFFSWHSQKKKKSVLLCKSGVSLLSEAVLSCCHCSRVPWTEQQDDGKHWELRAVRGVQPSSIFSWWCRACSGTVLPKINTTHLQRSCQLPREPVHFIFAIPQSEAWFQTCTRACMVTFFIIFQSLLELHAIEKERIIWKGQKWSHKMSFGKI